VPLTLEVLKSSIEEMTVADAKNILDGKDNAATQYIRLVSSERLQTKIAPIIKQATAETGVTKIYKTMYDKLGFAGKYLNLDDYDIDSYVTEKTMIEKEEKKIRDNPVERTTEVLKEAFGSL